MKFILIAILVLTVPIWAQSQTVSVDQSFIDSSAKAFSEVIALRKLDKAQQEVIEAKDAVIKAQRGELDAKNVLIDAQKTQIETLIKIKCSTSSFLLFIYRSKRCY